MATDAAARECVLVLAYDQPSEHETYRRGLGALLPDMDVTIAADQAEALRAAPRATVLVAMAHHVTQPLIDAAPHLRMIQSLTTGTDHLDTLVLPAGIAVASARGVHGPQMAELAFLFMLALMRRFRTILSNQAQARWERWPQPVLRGKTVVIFGVGTIAEDVALRCRAFGMRVIGVSGSRSDAPHFHAVLPRASLITAVSEADFLLILAPYSAATRHAIDADVMGACKPGAFLINIARGGVVDEDAMVASLRSGQLAGAGLDVFAQEPLPADSPLWHMENVLLTPHIGGMSQSYAEDLIGLIAHNIACCAAGDAGAMRNLVVTTRSGPA